MKILIIKLGARGDVLRTTAILPGLREKYPSAQIIWLTTAGYGFLLRKNPYLTHALEYSGEIGRKLLHDSFDLVINLDEDFEACSLATKIRKKKLIGFFLDAHKNVAPTPTMRSWFEMGALGKKPMNDMLKKENAKTYQQIMLEALGISPKNFDIYLHLDPSQKSFAREFRRRYNIRDTDFIIGINTGSGGRWPSKQLSVENTAQLINALVKEFKAKVILFGGEHEIERNDQILSLTTVPVINTGCGNDLWEFPALVNMCHTFITSDSFGLHVAAALKRKIVALIGPTSAHELELYGLGKKVVAKDPCVCCYKPDCRSMEAIAIPEILSAVLSLSQLSITVVITSFREPSLERALRAVVDQDYAPPFEIIVASPDPSVEALARSLSTPSRSIIWFKDPGKGKSFAINALLPSITTDILVFTDGDVVLDTKAIREFAALFRDPSVGCASGRVVSANPKNTMLGYWSHLLADAGAHRIRKELFEAGKFLECTGYLFAFRNRVIHAIPLDVAEDSIVPALFWERNYSVGYAERALVFVKNPTTLHEWFKQRKRTAKAHETLNQYIDVRRVARVKSFTNEIRKGLVWAISYPKSIREGFWTLLLLFARFSMWIAVLYDSRISRKHYHDAWERIETTKS